MARVVRGTRDSRWSTCERDGLDVVLSCRGADGTVAEPCSSQRFVQRTRRVRCSVCSPAERPSRPGHSTPETGPRSVPETRTTPWRQPPRHARSLESAGWVDPTRRVHTLGGLHVPLASLCLGKVLRRTGKVYPCELRVNPCPKSPSARDRSAGSTWQAIPRRRQSREGRLPLLVLPGDDLLDPLPRESVPSCKPRGADAEVAIRVPDRGVPRCCLHDRFQHGVLLRRVPQPLPRARGDPALGRFGYFWHVRSRHEV